MCVCTCVCTRICVLFEDLVVLPNSSRGPCTEIPSVNILDKVTLLNVISLWVLPYHVLHFLKTYELILYLIAVFSLHLSWFQVSLLLLCKQGLCPPWSTHKGYLWKEERLCFYDDIAVLEMSVVCSTHRPPKKTFLELDEKASWSDKMFFITLPKPLFQICRQMCVYIRICYPMNISVYFPFLPKFIYIYIYLNK